MQDGNAVPAAGPAADGAHPHGRTAGQDPVAAPRRPDGVEPVVMDAMRGAAILLTGVNVRSRKPRYGENEVWRTEPVAANPSRTELSG